MSDVVAASGTLQQRHVPTMAIAGLGAAASCALAITAWPILTTNTYAWILAGLLTLAGIPVAIIDVRTYKLPNRYVAPLATAGLVQAAAIAVASTNPLRLIIPIACGAIVFSAYTAMGMAGWFGFGDAKFAATLTITIAISSGYTSVFIVAVAVFIGGAQHLLLTVLDHQNPVHPHGPALVVAAMIILSLGLAGSL